MRKVHCRNVQQRFARDVLICLGSLILSGCFGREKVKSRASIEGRENAHVRI